MPQDLSYREDFNLPATIKLADKPTQDVINRMLYAIRWLAAALDGQAVVTGSGAPGYTPTDTRQPYIDTTNLRLYYYVNSAWHYVALT